MFDRLLRLVHESPSQAVVHFLSEGSNKSHIVTMEMQINKLVISRKITFLFFYIVI